MKVVLIPMCKTPAFAGEVTNFSLDIIVITAHVECHACEPRRGDKNGAGNPDALGR
jgi:hypothetical protein